MKEFSKANISKSRIIERRAKKRRLNHNPRLAHKISQMRLNIAPIFHVVTGRPAPEFPPTMLSLFLLTEDQLDALAHYYSQVISSEFTHAYPTTMRWDHDFLSQDLTLPENCRLSDLERLQIKMRLFARFIGMRGAETPLWQYEREVEILGNKIARSVRNEQLSLEKTYRGPLADPR